MGKNKKIIIEIKLLTKVKTGLIKSHDITKIITNYTILCVYNMYGRKAFMTLKKIL